MMVLLLEVSPGHRTEGGTVEPLGIIKLRRWVWESSKANVVSSAHITKYKKKHLKKKKSNICSKPKFSGRQEEDDRGHLWKICSYHPISWWKTGFCSSVQELDRDSHPHQLYQQRSGGYNRWRKVRRSKVHWERKEKSSCHYSQRMLLSTLNILQNLVHGLQATIWWRNLCSWDGL